ncbi:hypothetical protein D3C76_638970 [compost metagenome]
MSIDFERGVEITGDLIESFFDRVAGYPSGVGGADDFPIEGPTGREEEIFHLVRQRLQVRHPWVELTLKPSGIIGCAGIKP